MYDMATRKRALSLVAQGRSLNSASEETGISRSAIRSWQARIEPLPRIAGAPMRDTPADPAAYAYLLGLYLGDGCLSEHPHGGHHLRVACADAWPGLINECRTAITKVHPQSKVYSLQQQGYVSVTSYNRSWRVLFPQHAPGKKHLRQIALQPWQQSIVGEFPWGFIRGLVHSDGCRITNWTTRLIGGARKRYEYPRYFFTNKSDDIRRMFTDALDAVGVAWKHPNAWNISVARRASVALMDAHVGPKY
ncbi:helix-turn-helix domain-containing protein [Streptomyces sp. CA-294286]|uniref:helix-turn-helix domain-containing protein n=1 Tax=Streptomyces sp. CA-294286 TaxID=3240070 RepID=UPI003D91E043